MRIKTWNIESMTGYKPRTTFYEDFSIADHFGGPAIRDTYCRAFNAWQNNIEYMAELVMVLNWKIGEHYSRVTECIHRQMKKLQRILHLRYTDHDTD